MSRYKGWLLWGWGLIPGVAQASDQIAAGHAGISLPIFDIAQGVVSGGVAAEQAEDLPDGATPGGVGLRLRGSESLFARGVAGMYGSQAADAPTATLSFYVGGGLEYHYRDLGKLSPYVSGYVGVLFVSSPEAPPAVVEVGGGFGAEYFLTPSMSLAWEYRLGVAFQGSASPTAIGTGGSGLLLNLYF